METEKKDRRKKGVSPVIGVILMVAATIVIASVVLAMLGDFEPPKRIYAISVMASRAPDGNIAVIFFGGPDANYVQEITVSGDVDLTLTGSVGGTNTTTTNPGDTAHVVATATFTDGSRQVVLDTYV
jgi:flagellin-like protein